MCAHTRSDPIWLFLAHACCALCVLHACVPWTSCDAYARVHFVLVCVCHLLAGCDALTFALCAMCVSYAVPKVCGLRHFGSSPRSFATLFPPWFPPEWRCCSRGWVPVSGWSMTHRCGLALCVGLLIGLGLSKVLPFLIGRAAGRSLLITNTCRFHLQENSSHVHMFPQVYGV